MGRKILVYKEFSSEEIINFILVFYRGSCGCFSSEVDQVLGLRKFIRNGYAEKEENDPNFYVLSKDGKLFLHGCIEKITQEFARFIDGKRINTTVAFQWFAEQYQLGDVGTAEEICGYIIDNSHNCSIKITRGYSKSRGHFLCVT
jgi:hypothetical protein